MRPSSNIVNIYSYPSEFNIELTIMSQKHVITRVDAREILDSRGNPTVEATLYSGERAVTAAVPSGASTGIHEALELRDGDPNRYLGMGVLKAVKNVREIIGPKIVGYDPEDQAKIDRLMIDLDGTPNKGKLGANAILAVSLATAKLAAALANKSLFDQLSEGKGVTLPVPVMNIINGGKHAGTGLKIQEFMVIPAGAKNFSDSLRMGAEIYHKLKQVIQTKYGKQSVNVGDEGGFAPPITKTSDALDTIVQAITDSGYVPGKNVYLGFDAASSEFCNDGTYEIDGEKKSADELGDFYSELVQRYPIRYIEDPFEQEDFEHTAQFTRKVGKKVNVVGDDIFVTNIVRLMKGIQLGAANALLLKVNQIGTLTESVEAAKTAMSNQYSVVTSHRSGETEDSTIADLAVSLNCGQIKTGAPCRGERTAKYNRLLRIEEELGSRARFMGMNAVRQP
jgi:enolase